MGNAWRREHLAAFPKVEDRRAGPLSFLNLGDEAERSGTEYEGRPLGKGKRETA